MERVGRGCDAPVNRRRLARGVHDHAHAGQVCVCELVPLFDVSQPTVSHHLRVLRDAGLVGSKKRGLWVYYFVVPGAMDDLVRWLSTAEPAIGLRFQEEAV